MALLLRGIARRGRALLGSAFAAARRVHDGRAVHARDPRRGEPPAHTLFGFYWRGQRLLGAFETIEHRHWGMRVAWGSQLMITRRQVTFQFPPRETPYKPGELRALEAQVDALVEELRRRSAVEIVYRRFVGNGMFTTADAAAVLEPMSAPLCGDDALWAFVVHRLLEAAPLQFKPHLVWDTAFECQAPAMVREMEAQEQSLQLDQKSNRAFLLRLWERLSELGVQTSRMESAVAELREAHGRSLGSEDLAWEPHRRGEDRMRLGVLRRYALTAPGRGVPDSRVHERLLLPLGLGSSPAEVFQLLLQLGEMSAADDVPLMQSGVTLEHTAESLEAAHKLASSGALPDPDAAIREDFRNGPPVFCIDSSTTQDVDDGVSIEPAKASDPYRWVHVHVADVSRVIALDSVLEKEARIRSTSVYLPHSTGFMFPEVLTNGVLSLRDDVADNYAFSFSLCVDMATGAIANYVARPARIPRVIRLNYEEASAAIEGEAGGPLDDGQRAMIRELFRVAKALRAHRMASGGWHFRVPQTSLRVQTGREKGTMINLAVSASEQPSQVLVSELMVGAGHATGLYARQHGIPVFYRTQENPRALAGPADEATLDGEIAGEGEDAPMVAMVDDLARLENVAAASVSVDAERHSALGIDAYTQVTSPIRRYRDLVAHRQIKAFLRKEPYAFSRAEMERMLTPIDQRTRMVAQLQRESTQFWVIRRAAEMQPMVFGGIVVRPGDFDEERGQALATVWVEELGVRSLVRVDRPVRRMDRIRLYCEVIDPLQNVLRMRELVIRST